MPSQRHGGNSGGITPCLTAHPRDRIAKCAALSFAPPPLINSSKGSMEFSSRGSGFWAGGCGGSTPKSASGCDRGPRIRGKPTSGLEGALSLFHVCRRDRGRVLFLFKALTISDRYKT